MPTLDSRTQRVLTALTRAWGEGRVDELDRILSPRYVRHGRSSTMSLAELKASIADMRRAFPDLTLTIDDVVQTDDRLSIIWSSTGTLMDTYLGLPPTGRTFSVRGATFSRFEDGLIVDETVIYDRRGEYRSLGLNLPRGAGEDQAGHTGVDPTALRSVHRKLVTGVTVVTTQAADEPRGLAVNAFSSVSLEPPQILICVQKSSSTYSHLIAAKHFGVNILAADQVPVANVFATKQERKFDRIAWHAGTYGVPVVDGACAHMEVELQDTLHASTHTIFIGKVVHVEWNEKPPLIYTDGQFFDGSRLAPAEAPLDS
jgi:steroid delta-isomerase-like uncharacterized protein